LAALSIVGGWLSIPGLTDVPGHFITLVGVSEEASEGSLFGWPLLVILGVAVLGTLIAIMRYGTNAKRSGNPQSVFAEEGFHLDAFYNAVVVKPLHALALAIGMCMEPRIVDGAVNGIGNLVQVTANGVRSLHAGYVRRYALTVFAGATLLIAYYVLI
jgi:NADH-quinone oxidoreductase subunit L